MVNKNKNSPKKKKMLSLTNKVAQEAWHCMVMFIGGISSVEAKYEEKKLILGFKDLIDMTNFLHLTDLIFSREAEAKNRRKQI